MLPYAFNQLRQAALNYQLNGGGAGAPTHTLDPRAGAFPPGPNPYAAALNPYAALDPLLGYRAFGPRFIHEEPKPQHSYIGLIAMGILSSPEKKMVLSDIYQWILDNYSYFRNRGPGWRNSIRHNLSLNDCFIKSGRSANGKGHYWAIHPANEEDFKKGDFRRRRAQRKVRKHMGLTVPDDEEDSDESPCTSPIHGQTNLQNHITNSSAAPICGPPLSFPPTHTTLAGLAPGAPTMEVPKSAENLLPSPKFTGSQISPAESSGESSGDNSSVDISPRNCVPLKKRMFDVESLLAPEQKRPKLQDSPPSPKTESKSPLTGVAPAPVHPVSTQCFNPLTLSPGTAAKFGISAAPFFPFGFPLSPTGIPSTNPWSAFAPFAVAPAAAPMGAALPGTGQKASDLRSKSPSPNAAAQWQETFAKIMARSYQGRQQQLGHPKQEPEGLNVSNNE